MGAAWEVLLSFLAVTGLLALCWLGFGCLLTPAGGTGALCVLPAAGEGSALEQEVAGLLWLRAGGVLGGRILIVDCGLTPEGLAVAQKLAEREPLAALCSVEELQDYIEKG